MIKKMITPHNRNSVLKFHLSIAVGSEHCDWYQVNPFSKMSLGAVTTLSLLGFGIFPCIK